MSRTKHLCKAGWCHLLLCAAHLFRLRVINLLRECAERSGSLEQRLMFDLPKEHEQSSLLCQRTLAGSSTDYMLGWVQVSLPCQSNIQRLNTGMMRYMVILNFKTWCSSFSWATEIKTTPHVMLKSLHIHIQYCRLTVTGSAYPKQNASPLLRLYARDTLQGSDSWWWLKKTFLRQHDS